MAAFQCLGSFISTFADASVTGLYFNDEGVLTVGNAEDFKRYSTVFSHWVGDCCSFSLTIDLCFTENYRTNRKRHSQTKT